MTFLVRITFSLVLFVWLGVQAEALNYEPYRFREWTRTDGLWDSYSRTVNFGASGGIVVNHGDVDNFSVINEYGVTHFPKHHERGMSLRPHILERPKNVFWSVYFDRSRNEGGLTKLVDGIWREYPLPFMTLNLYATRCFYPINESAALFIQKDKLWRIDLDARTEIMLLSASSTPIGAFLSIQNMQNQLLYIVGEKGFLVLPLPTATSSHTPECETHLWDDIPDSWKIQSLRLQNDRFGVGLFEEGGAGTKQCFVFQDGRFSIYGPPSNVLQNAWPGPDESFWESRDLSHIYTSPALSDPFLMLDRLGVLESFVFDITAGRRSFWIATSSGVLECSPNLFRFPSGYRKKHGSPLTIREDNNRKLWIAYLHSLCSLATDTDEASEWPLPPTDNRSDACSIFPVANNQMVFWSYQYNPNLLLFSTDTGRMSVYNPPDNISVNRVFPYDDRSVMVLTHLHPLRKNTIERFDGLRWETLAPQPDLATQLDGRCMVRDRNGCLWLAVWGNDGLYRFRDERWEIMNYNPSLKEKAILSLLELQDGSMLAGGRNNLYRYDGDTWSVILYNVEKIRSLAQDKSGRIWIGSDDGLYCYSESFLVRYTIDDGLPSNKISQVAIARDGTVWVCTPRGVIFFDPSNDTAPPDTYVSERDNPSFTIYNETAMIKFSGIDSWKHTPSNRLLYSYRLNGSKWSPFSEGSSLALNRLGIGKHVLDVRSMDLALNVDPSPASYEFHVVPVPLQQKAWFASAVASVLAALLLLTGITIYAWRRVKDQAVILERTVDQRTQDLKQAYSQLQEDAEKTKELEKQLHQTQKMEAIGQLAGGVAHDFNNMLGVILGYVELGLTRVQPKDLLYSYLEQINQAARRSANLTRQLLAFARKQPATPITVDLNEIVDSMTKMLQRLIGEGIELEWRPEDNLSHIKIDPAQIDQILANLCVNARDAIDGEGKIVIETNNATIDERYCQDREGVQPGNYVQLSISDNGCGIAKETMERIFEPFYTTKEEGRGTGLGLSTVYGIVKQNDGFIYAYSELNRGTTFKIYLPEYVGELESTPSGDNVEEIPRGDATILLVEDEPSLLELGLQMLEDRGYRVFAAGSPKEAIRLARDYDGEIDLLLTDVVMPEMNGKELFDRIVSIYPKIKCLYTSGYTANVIAQHGVLEDDVQFLPKPYSLKSLAENIRLLLHRD